MRTLGKILDLAAWIAFGILGLGALLVIEDPSRYHSTNPAVTLDKSLAAVGAIGIVMLLTLLLPKNKMSGLLLVLIVLGGLYWLGTQSGIR